MVVGEISGKNISHEYRRMRKANPRSSQPGRT